MESNLYSIEITFSELNKGGSQFGAKDATIEEIIKLLNSFSDELNQLRIDNNK